MFRNWLEKQRTVGVQGGTNPAPRPGNYPLGSLESRVAARAILDSKKLYACCATSLSALTKGKTILYTLSTISKPGRLETA
jgi:hypothetical protein